MHRDEFALDKLRAGALIVRFGFFRGHDALALGSPANPWQLPAEFLTGFTAGSQNTEKAKCCSNGQKIMTIAGNMKEAVHSFL